MSNSDKHFSEAAWCDFVRQLVAADQRTEMRAHLDAGCTECTQSYNVWVQVAQIAAPEVENEPPRDGIQSVKSAFPRSSK